MITGLIAVHIVLAGWVLIANFGQLGSSTASTAPVSRTAAPAPSTASRSIQAGSRPTAAPRASTGSHPAAHALGVASIVAFGPQGTADGDNPGLASGILNVATAQPWYSQWYATPEFGNLRPGTGLLLDLGQTATVTDVGLSLGSTRGTDVQIRVGDSPGLGMPTVGNASGVGGSVHLTLNSRAKGRYVLIWFTRLPPIGGGHYQVSVYNVSVEGTSRS